MGSIAGAMFFLLGRVEYHNLLWQSAKHAEFNNGLRGIPSSLNNTPIESKDPLIATAGRKKVILPAILGNKSLLKYLESLTRNRTQKSCSVYSTFSNY